MTSRFETRLSAAEEKAAGGNSDNAVQLFFVSGNPKDGEAEELLRGNGRDLSKPHKIIAFILGKDDGPSSEPLIDITDEIRRGAA